MAHGLEMKQAGDTWGYNQKIENIKLDGKHGNDYSNNPNTSSRARPVAIWDMTYGIASKFNRNPWKIAKKNSCASGALVPITMTEIPDDHASAI